MICVVEDVRDVIAIENTSQYKGLYHVLGGIISPMEGVGPGDLATDSLFQRLQNPVVKEVIMALSATMEGDTTVFYLYKKISQAGRNDIRLLHWQGEWQWATNSSSLMKRLWAGQL
jgi:recombination protein RecR